MEWVSKRIQIEHKKMEGSILKKDGDYWVIDINKENKNFKFYIDKNYPFSPPIKLYCNGKDMRQCSMTKYCYSCHSIICERNWSPSTCLHHIIDDYIMKLRESELLTDIALVAKRVLPNTSFPSELIEHICSFIF
tara:strand:- start:4 stop:408 length:405 start_codon:yes stop_codon:yes gene_type:complete